ncbi:myosin heavy chain [Trypanosoma grayi]|uniref:myosin heavy chain n=1 Tax=Trypanosoma grayi TaxID=71804 RepID=UPI0004F419AB|nr:myosin heavy chain [Trypanosoma grayi]KEG10384.1 myosin heavy chain [Trypanosoma grayi]
MHKGGRAGFVKYATSSSSSDGNSNTNNKNGTAHNYSPQLAQRAAVTSEAAEETNTSLMVSAIGSVPPPFSPHTVQQEGACVAPEISTLPAGGFPVYEGATKAVTQLTSHEADPSPRRFLPVPVASSSSAGGIGRGDELRIGTKVIFQRPATTTSGDRSSMAWELGKIVEVMSAYGGGGDDKACASAESDNDVVILEELATGTCCRGRVRTTRKNVWRYTYEGSSFDLNDLTTLPDPSDAAVLYSLRQRYFEGLHYTFVGRMLLAVNPYQRSVYPPHAPHPRHVAEAAREALRGQGCISCSNENGYNGTEGDAGNGDYAKLKGAAPTALQRPVAVIVTGESGAGKTETAKLVLHHFLRHVGGEGTHLPPDTHEAAEATPKRILRILDAANCLLESFGNASTPLNSNSSRFAKCVTTFLDPRSTEGVGAHVECYLLEVSRLTARSLDESTFHIFTMLFDETHGLTSEEQSRFDVWDPSLFRAMLSDVAGLYLSSPPYTLAEVRMALQSLGFDGGTVDAILRVLCGILHILNIEFTAPDLFAPASITSGSMPACTKAAALLGFPPTEAHTSLEAMLITVRLGQDVRQLHTAAAEAARDSVAKHLYESLFRYILRGINDALAPADAGAANYTRFSILDIFGFEVKDASCGNNDLEQLLINYANETVQRLYEESTFDSLLAESAREGVQLDIPANENCERKAAFDLFVRRPQGVLNIINDDSLLAQRSRQESGTNLAALLADLKQVFPGLVKPHQTDPSKVCVEHYCASVVYETRNMSAKNRLSTSAASICATSSDTFVLEVCDAFLASPTLKQQPQSPFSDDSAKLLAARSRATTLIAQFRSQMEMLVAQLKASRLFWIRCIKPNIHKSPHEFDCAFVLSQLQHSAVLRSLMLFGKGYCHSLGYQDFVRKYLSLAVRGYCCDAPDRGGSSKGVSFSSSHGTYTKPRLRHSVDSRAFGQQVASFHTAVYRASFREACLLATRFVPCCTSENLLLGASKVFVRPGTLRMLLALGDVARGKSSKCIGRVGRAYIQRRELAAARVSHLKERRLAAIRERIAREMPEREKIERERESMLTRVAEGRAEELAVFSRQAMKSSKRVGSHWKNAMELLVSELTNAFGEMSSYEAARMQKEKEVRDEAAMLEMYRAQARNVVEEKRRQRETVRRRQLEAQQKKRQEGAKDSRRSCADIDAERAAVIQEEIIKARQLQMRVEEEILVERRQRTLQLKERKEARQVRLHLDRQQRRIADQVRLKGEMKQRHLASQRYLQMQSLPCSEEVSLDVSGADRSTKNGVKKNNTVNGLVISPRSKASRTASRASGLLPIQQEGTFSTSSSRDGHDAKVEWVVQKDMMALWESLHDGQGR